MYISHVWQYYLGQEEVEFYLYIRQYSTCHKSPRCSSGQQLIDICRNGTECACGCVRVCTNTPASPIDRYSTVDSPVSWGQRVWGCCNKSFHNSENSGILQVKDMPRAHWHAFCVHVRGCRCRYACNTACLHILHVYKGMWVCLPCHPL